MLASSLFNTFDVYNVVDISDAPNIDVFSVLKLFLCNGNMMSFHIISGSPRLDGSF